VGGGIYLVDLRLSVSGDSFSSSFVGLYYYSYSLSVNTSRLSNYLLLLLLMLFESFYLITIGSLLSSLLS